MKDCRRKFAGTGFPYVFYARLEDKEAGKRPMIAVAGDCAQSAYLFRPELTTSVGGRQDKSANYKLMVEIDCQSTVGSIGIGYADFTSEEQEQGYAKLYIPCYERDKVLVFALGSGTDTLDDGW